MRLDADAAAAANPKAGPWCPRPPRRGCLSGTSSSLPEEDLRSTGLDDLTSSEEGSDVLGDDDVALDEVVEVSAGDGSLCDAGDFNLLEPGAAAEAEVEATGPELFGRLTTSIFVTEGLGGLAEESFGCKKQNKHANQSQNLNLRHFSRPLKSIRRI